MPLFLFKNIHHVIIAEGMLKEKGIRAVVVPLPRHLAPDCGIALEISDEISNRALRYLEKCEVSPVRVIDTIERKMK